MKKSVLPLVSRRLAGLMFVLSFVFLFSACSESDSVSEATPQSSSSYKCATCKTNPEALPENDNSNKGIYFGITQAGIITFDIDNQNNGQIRAIGNNASDAALSLESSSYTEDGYRAIFSGKINHVPTDFEFKVSSDGSNPTIDFLVSDSSGKLTSSTCFVYKEKSNAMVEVFEGGITRSLNGSSSKESAGKTTSPVNFEPMGNAMYLFSRATNQWCVLKVKNDQNVEISKGTISGSILLDENGTNVGKLISDQASQMIDLHENGKLLINAFRVL